MNSKGTTLFTVDNFHEPSSTARTVPHDPEYYSSAINAKTGRLSPRAYFYASPLVLGDSIFAVGASLAGPPQPITVFSISAQDILAQSDSSMLVVCGDDLSAVYIHPSDKSQARRSQGFRRR